MPASSFKNHGVYKNISGQLSLFGRKRVSLILGEVKYLSSVSEQRISV